MCQRYFSLHPGVELLLLFLLLLLGCSVHEVSAPSSSHTSARQFTGGAVPTNDIDGSAQPRPPSSPSNLTWRSVDRKWSRQHLRYMSVYGWEAGLTASMKGWINLAKGPVDIRNASNSKPSVRQQIEATLHAHRELGAPVLWGLPSGIVTPGGTSLPRGWSEKLDELHSTLSPLVRTGVIAGFFTGDEQCANGTCIEHQLGPVAKRLHELFDPDGAVVVYANEALKVCDPRRGNASWVLPDSIDLFSIDVYGSGGLAEVDAVKTAVQTCIMPRLRPHQFVMLVPGVFGNSGLPLGQGRCTGLNKYGHPAYAQNETVAVLQGLFEWAQADSRIAGFCPWHYNDRCGVASPPAHCHDAKPPCDMDRGAVSMPLVKAKLEEIGRAIISGSWQK